MKQRSSHNWKSKAGTWDYCKTELLDFETDYAIIKNATQNEINNIVSIHNYNKITPGCTIISFIDDYILERYWNNPKKYINRLSVANYVFSPDYSLLIGMPKPMLQWQVYRNRLVGYVWQKHGINVIPTISWSDEKSFDFFCEGVEQGGIVAISNIGCRSDEHKKFFDAGLNEMMLRLNPKKVLFLCNNKYKAMYDNPIFEFIKPITYGR